MNNIEVKLNGIVQIIWNIFCTYDWIRHWNELMKKTVSRETVSALLYPSSIFTLMLPISRFFKNKNKKSNPFISSTQNSNILPAVKIKLLIGHFRLCSHVSFWNGLEVWPTKFLKTDGTKKIISKELKHILPSCKKHWKAYLILL